MVSLCQTIALVVCITHLPSLTSAFFKGAGMRKRFSKGFLSPPSSNSHQVESDISFTNTLPEITVRHKHGSVVMECEAHAIPSPTIHWLKNGIRMKQGDSNLVSDDAATFEDHPQATGVKMIQVSSTKSRLFLDCLTSRDQGQYTCVAETPYLKKTLNTTLKVVKRDYDVSLEEIEECVGKRSRKGEPARIHMWTVTRIEYEGTNVQLFCRAQGYPTPTITWYDRNNEAIVDGDEYTVLDNGDLIVKSIAWYANMGNYMCVADNAVGTDTSTSFLYPTAHD